MQKTKTRSFLGRLLRGSAVLAMAALVLPKLGALKAEASTYNLKICGTSVTDDNKSDILGDGVFSYDSTANKLFVNGSKTNDTDTNLIYANFSGLTIEVTADSVLTQNGSGAAIYLFGGATIKGPGELTVQSTKSSNDAIYCYSLTIDNLSLTAVSAGGDALEGLDDLRINSSDVHLKSGSSSYCYAINDYGHISLKGCHIASPTNCVLTSGTSKTSDGSAVHELIIEREILELAGKDVFADTTNQQDIFGDGNFRYIPASRTLLIAGNLTTSDNVLYSTVPGLTVVVERNCELTSTGKPAFELKGDTTITGKGQLRLTSQSSIGIYVQDCAKLTFSEITANISADSYGITGNSSEGDTEAEELLFSHSRVTVSAGSQGAVTDFYGCISFIFAAPNNPYERYMDLAYIYDTDSGSYDACPYCEIVPLNTDCWSLMTWIDGVQVTAANQDDILGNGVFRYDMNGKILCVDGEYASICNDVISTYEEYLTIEYADGTELTALGSNRNAIWVSEETSFIKGDGALTVTSEQSSAIYVSDCRLWIEPKTDGASPTVVATGAGYALEGYNNGGLTLVDTVLMATATNDSGKAVGGFGSGITLNGCSITAPDGAFIQNGTVLNAYGNAASYVETVRLIYYPVLVNDVQVTNLNCDDILGDGLFKYLPGYNELYVKGDFTSQGDLIRVFNEVTVKVPDSVTLKSENGDVIASEAKMYLKIAAGKKLTLEAPNGSAIYMDNKLIIQPYSGSQPCELSATGWCGIRGCGTANELYIYNANVTAKSTDTGGTGGDAISGFVNGIVLEDCRITAGGTVQNGAVVGSNGSNSMNVTITALKKYDLGIDGTQVTELNQNDILGNGVFTFIPASNTLVIDGSYTSTNSAAMLYSKISGLRIEVISDSVLDTFSRGYDMFYLDGDTTVTGTGKLTLNAGDELAEVCGCTLTFDGIEVEATAYDDGFYGSDYGATGSKLVFKGVKLKLTTGSSDCAAVGFKGGIELIDCRLAQPAGAQIYVDGNGYACIADSSNSAYISSITINNSKALTEDMVTLNKTSFPYTGSEIDATAYVTVKDGSKTLVPGTDYTVTVFNGTSIGTNTALIRIRGIGEYDGIVNKSVTIYPSQPASVTAAVGATAKFTVNVTGEGYTYQWQYYNTNTKKWVNSGMTGSTTATLSVEVTAARDGQKYRCLVTDAYGAKAYSNAATLKVKPAITTQPKNTSAAVGETAKFTIAASGSGLKYQWQYYNTNTSKWVNSGLTGNTTATLSVPVTAARDGQKYRCIVTAANGATATSSTAVLKVKPAITAQPANVTAAVGATAKFTVKASGTGLKYQWQYDNGSGWKNSTQTGYNTATLSIPVTAARDGQKYRCVITGSNGASANSNAATLKVKTVITKQPANVTAAVGATAKFTVTATGNELKYQWQYDNGSGWKNSSQTGYNTATLSVPVTEARNGQKYRCIVTGKNSSATSNAATLTVNVPTAITTQPANVTAAVGATAKFTVAATGSGLKYQWQYYNTNTSKWVNSGMTGAATATLSVEVTAARDGQKYRCVVTDSKGTTLNSNAATLKVKAAITGQPANVTAAVGATAKFTVTATGNELSYQWQVYTGGEWKNSSATGNKTATLSVAVIAARNGQKYRCIVTAKNGTTVTSTAAVLKVKTAITAQPKSVTQAAGTTAKFTVTATGVDLNYQWQVYTSGAWKDSSAEGNKTATLSVAVIAARNGQKYRCVVTGKNGSVTSSAATLTVS